MTTTGKRKPFASSERTDLYLMQPRNSAAENMRSRLALNETLNMQEGPALVSPGKFRPQKGAVLVYHLHRHADVEMVRQQILSLARSSNANYQNVVICAIRGDEHVRTMIEALPLTSFVPGDVPGHDSDLILLKMIRRWRELAAEAASNEKPETGPFIEVKALDEQRRLVKDAVDSRALVVVSPYGSTCELKGYFFAFDEARGVIRCQLEGKDEELEQIKKEIDNSKRVALSLALKQSRVFFATTDFHWSGRGVLEIKSPSLLYFVQRRKNFRHVVYAEARHTLQMQAGGKEMTCDIHDLSVGGLSIICSAKELSAIKNASGLTGLQFQLDGQTIRIDKMKLRHGRKFRGTPGSELFHVGFSFEQIAPGFADTLAKFVNIRAARYFQTYVIRL